MGIDTYFLTMYGVKIPYNEELFKYIDENNIDLEYETSDMDCEFMILGHTIFKSENLRWDSPWGFEEIDWVEAEWAKIAYINKFNELLPTKFWHLLEDNPWKIITFVLIT